MKTKELQAILDVKVSIRQYWRSIRAATSAPETKTIVECLSARIKAKAEEYVRIFDKCDPTDAPAIARLQEGRLLCLEIVKELDAETANKMVAKLDEEIKALSDQIAKVSRAEVPSGYDALMER